MAIPKSIKYPMGDDVRELEDTKKWAEEKLKDSDLKEPERDFFEYVIEIISRLSEEPHSLDTVEFSKEMSEKEGFNPLVMMAALERISNHCVCEPWEEDGKPAIRERRGPDDTTQRFREFGVSPEDEGAGL